MDSYLKKRQIGQDQPDRQDIAAFGRRPLAVGEKIPLILFILSKKLDSNPILISSTTRSFTRASSLAVSV